MIFIIGWGSRDRDGATGYMYCPNCRSRNRAVSGLRKTYLSFFFIPIIPISEDGAYYRCEGC